MLVLTRKEGEEIVVPDCEITLTVLEISRSKVRVGVSAPSGVVVHRAEVWRRICGLAAEKPGLGPRDGHKKMAR